MKIALIVLFVVAFAGIPIGLFGRWQFLKRLRNHHPAIWKGLGRPAVFDSFGKTLRVLRFMYSDQLATIDDGTLKRAAYVEKGVIAIAVLSSVAYLVLFLVYMGYI